jgi:hypothetical protein
MMSMRITRKRRKKMSEKKSDNISLVLWGFVIGVLIMSIVFACMGVDRSPNYYLGFIKYESYPEHLTIANIQRTITREIENDTRKEVTGDIIVLNVINKTADDRLIID